MMEQRIKIKFPSDTHERVMTVRATVELILFVIFVLLSQKIPQLQRFPYLGGFKIGVSSALLFSLIFIFLVIWRKSRGQSLKIITNLEAIGDAILIIWLIFIFGGMNGPFFFFFFLSLMETAFTLDFKTILVVATLGILSLVGDYIFKTSQEISIFNIQSFIFLFFRLLSVLLISYYGYSFARSIKREREAVQKAENLTNELQKTKEKVEKAYELEKYAHQELKRLDEAKSQFMLATQHHLRTPLTSMQGYLDLLLSGIYGKIPEKIKEILGRFQKSTKNEIKIVEELLNISQFQLGKQVVFLQPNFEVEDVLKEIIEELKSEAENKGIYLKLEKPDNLPKIKADNQKLKVALFNIIDNAVKYTEKGGVIVKLETTDSRLRIIIKDTGIGIDKGEAANLFTRIFERNKIASKLYTTGRGIGMYISAKIIQAHNGKVWAESEGLGKGSTFFVELPIG